MTGRNQGASFAELARRRGIAIFRNGPDTEITSLSRALFGGP